MTPVTVLDLFQTSPGLVAILDFPEGTYPKPGMRLKRSDEAFWKITRSGMGKFSDMTKGYNHLRPSRIIFDCVLEAENGDKKLVAGDALSIL